MVRDDLLKKSAEVETLQRTVAEQVRGAGAESCRRAARRAEEFTASRFPRGEGPGGDLAEGGAGQALPAGLRAAQDQERPPGQHQGGGDLSKAHGEAVAQDAGEDSAPLKKSFVCGNVPSFTVLAVLFFFLFLFI